MDEVKLLPCEPTPEMASAGMHIISALPAEAGWPELARAACDVYRAMAKAAPTTVVTDEVVERVAKAMADDLSKRHYGIDRGPEDAWEAQTDYGRDEWRHAARAALASMPTVVTGE